MATSFRGTYLFFFSSGGSKAECVECKLKQEAHLLEE